MNELLCKKRSQQEKKIIIGFSLLVIINKAVRSQEKLKSKIKGKGLLSV